jgi:hypothetical protein
VTLSEFYACKPGQELIQRRGGKRWQVVIGYHVADLAPPDRRHRVVAERIDDNGRPQRTTIYAASGKNWERAA